MRIYLTRKEKEVLRLVQFHEDCPDTYPSHIFSACVDTLERKGLVNAIWASGHELYAVRLSYLGESYLALNPRLKNPINWDFVGTISLIIAAFIAIISLFILYTKI
jgi:hypothetical protein